MDITRLKKILDLLEEFGHGDNWIGADCDVIYLISIEEFNALPQRVQHALCGNGEPGEEGYILGLGCFVDEELDCIHCIV